MDTPVPETYSKQKWEAARLTIYTAYKGGKPIPKVEDHQTKGTQHILVFLNHHFELATRKGQNQDQPIRNALHALVCASNPAPATALNSLDPTDPTFVSCIQYTFQSDRPLDLRKTSLLFLPLICDRWFNTRSPIMNPKQMKSFCVDWASAVDCVERTPDVKTAALTVLLEMINSPRWRPHIVKEKLGLLEDLKLVPDGFQPLHSCINNPDLVDAIRGVGNPMAIVHWVTILWSKYSELGRKVRERLEATTKEIVQNEQRLDASRSSLGKCLSSMASELAKAKDELKQYFSWPPDPAADPLEKKAQGLELAIKTLDAIRQGRTPAGAEA